MSELSIRHTNTNCVEHVCVFSTGDFCDFFFSHQIYFTLHVTFCHFFLSLFSAHICDSPIAFFISACNLPTVGPCMCLLIHVSVVFFLNNEQLITMPN
jgi:hypothetical protein